jgi:signal transduction histidine kinase
MRLAAYQGEGGDTLRVMHSLEADGKLGEVLYTHKAFILPEVSAERQAGAGGAKVSFVCFPMRTQGRVVGAFVVQKQLGDPFVVQELTLLSFIADHLAMVVENHQLFRKAQQAAILDERSRLARDLHDSVTQTLYSANLFAVGAQRYMQLGKPDEVSPYLEQIGTLTQQALRDLRLMIYELRSPELAQSGLLGALQNRLDAVERRAKIDAQIRCQEPVRLPDAAEENLYRIAIEALNNSLKHAAAAHILVELALLPEGLIFAVEDDGAGFDPQTARLQGGVGLVTMRERTERIGGRLRVRSAPAEGTRVEVFLPSEKLGPAAPERIG